MSRHRARGGRHNAVGDGQTARATQFFPNPGVTGGLFGRKRDLTEGGVRVPGLLEWPARLGKVNRVTDYAISTVDYLPTLADLLGIHAPHSWPVDGASLLPLIDGHAPERPPDEPLGWLFKTPLGSTNAAYARCSTHPCRRLPRGVPAATSPPEPRTHSDARWCGREGYPGCPRSTALEKPALVRAKHVPEAFDAMQCSWVEGSWKLLGCRDNGTQPWRFFLFNVTPSTPRDDPAADDVLAANHDRAVAMAERLYSWMRSVEASQGPAETNCSAKWAGRSVMEEDW